MSNNFLWPDVSLPENAKAACKQAAQLAWFIAGMTGIAVGLSLAGVGLVQAMGFDFWSLIDVTIFAALGFGVYKHSRVAAVLLLIFYGLERVLGMVLAVEAGETPTSGIVFTLIFGAAFFGAIRGAFALARMRAETGSAPNPGDAG
ncbi:MAG: hypothetical protein ACI9KE_000080 [Polyangiales bacterium]|jgi:hypothetical protein